jgi:hypothetical protein
MSMTPEEIQAYQSRRNALSYQYANQLAQLGARQQYDNIDYGRGIPRLTDTWNRAAEGLGAGFARRGMSNSGVFQRGMQNYLGDRQNAFDDARIGHQRTQDMFTGQANSMGSTYAMGQAQIDSEEAARRSSMAASLRALNNG